MKKRIFCLVLAILIFSACGTMGVLADYSVPQTLVEYSETEPISVPENVIEIDLTKEKPMSANDLQWNMARGTSVPTQKWDFVNNGGYYGNFSGVAAGIYTNYYFTGVSVLRVRFDNLTTTGSTQLVYMIKDLSNNTVYGPYTSEIISGSSNLELFRQFTVSSSGKYCVFFRTNNYEQISGRITVNTSMW